MRLRNLIKRLKYPRSIPLYLVTIVPLIVHIGITLNLVNYFTFRREQQITQNLANQSSESIRDRVFPRLDNYPEPLDNQPDSQETKSFVNNVNNLLPQIDVPYLANVILIDNKGSILASNHRQQDSKLTEEDAITSLERRFPNLTQIKKPENFNFAIKQEQFLAQAIPWQNSKLNENYLLIVTIPKSELTSILNQQPEQLWQKHLVYLLPTTLLAVISYMWLAHIINKLSKNARAIAQGQLNVTIKKAPITELTSLANSLEEIIKGLQKSKQPSQTTIDYVKSSLLADLSHELRSPLNAILGFAQIMQQESSMTRSQRENLAIINRSGKRLLSIINDLVDLSKIETNRLQLEYNSFDFDVWLDNLEQSVKFQAHNQGMEFTLIRHDKLPQCICTDERRLRQIMTNLINYCLRYNQTGELIVRVACLPSPLNSAKQQSTSNTSHIYFEVENIDFPHTPQEVLASFDPAVSARKKRRFDEGSPLRLPISYHLAKLLKGDLTVSSNNNLQQGITFRLDIQTEAVVTPELIIPSTSKTVIGLETDQPDYRILVVDDSKSNRQIMVQLLERVGFEVQEAVNGKEAVDAWLRWHPHMIWMDIRMPIMNGYEATEQIKSYNSTNSTNATKSPLIVALTASTSEEEQLLFKAAGCDDFVGKPFSEGIIFDKIAQHLGVRYVYESIKPVTISNFKLTADKLKIMSNEWLNQLEEATSRLDANLLTELLQEIPQEHFELKDALQKQVDDFDFDKILTLIDQSKSQEN
jgi:signal transduction histidine kinase/CheY-like chemotaxis protein